MSKLLRFSVVVFIFTSALLLAQSTPDEWLQLGDKLGLQGKHEEAFKDFEKASKASGQKCSKCFFKMAFSKIRLGDEGGAKKFAKKAIEVAQTPQERADAYAVQGEAFLTFADENRKDLAQAEESYKTALKEEPGMAVLHLRVGSCLVRQDKIEDAKKEFQSYLDLVPDSKDAPLVRKWIENPLRAKYTSAPEFEFTSLTGEKITLAQFAGKVVVLDFWGTWCPPCRASVPELKDLTRKYPAEKLVVISISSDDDAEKWTKFIADNKMDWVQYRDTDRRIQNLYNVHSYPTYIVIDKDGSIRERISGMSSHQSLASRINGVLKQIL